MFVNFGDFVVNPERQNVFSFVDGCSVNIRVALSPNSKTEVPELKNQVGGQVCGGVSIMEVAFALVVVMSAEPGGGIPAAEKIGPSDGCLVLVGELDEA